MQLVPLIPSECSGKNNKSFTPLVQKSCKSLLCMFPIFPGSYGWGFYSLHSPVKVFCFQALSSILNFSAAFHTTLLSPLDFPPAVFPGCYLSLACVSVVFLLLQPPKTVILPHPSPHPLLPLSRYKQKYLQCAVEHNAVLAREWTK